LGGGQIPQEKSKVSWNGVGAKGNGKVAGLKKKKGLPAESKKGEGEGKTKLAEEFLPKRGKDSGRRRVAAVLPKKKQKKLHNCPPPGKPANIERKRGS